MNITLTKMSEKNTKRQILMGCNLNKIINNNFNLKQ